MRKLGYVMGITDLGSVFRNFKNWGGERPPNKNFEILYFDPCRVRKGQGQRYYGFWSLRTCPKDLEKNFAHGYSPSPFMGACQEMGQSYLHKGERCYWKSKHIERYLIDIAWGWRSPIFQFLLQSPKWGVVTNLLPQKLSALLLELLHFNVICQRSCFRLCPIDLCHCRCRQITNFQDGRQDGGNF